MDGFLIPSRPKMVRAAAGVVAVDEGTVPAAACSCSRRAVFRWCGGKGARRGKREIVID